MISFKGRHYKKTIILMAVRWYVAYSLSYRDIEEMMLERGVLVDHSTINRWVIRYAPQLELEFRKKHIKGKLELVGAWMKHIFSLKGNGVICIAQLIKLVIRLIFCYQQNVIKYLQKRSLIKLLSLAVFQKKVVIDKSGSNFLALKEVNNLQAKNEKIRDPSNKIS